MQEALGKFYSGEEHGRRVMERIETDVISRALTLYLMVAQKF